MKRKKLTRKDKKSEIGERESDWEKSDGDRGTGATRSFLCFTKLLLNEWTRSLCPRASQQIGTDTMAVIHGEVLEAIIQGNIGFVWNAPHIHDTIDADNCRLLSVSDFFSLADTIKDGIILTGFRKTVTYAVICLRSSKKREDKHAFLIKMNPSKEVQHQL